jgi:type II secretion system protein G
MSKYQAVPAGRQVSSIKYFGFTLIELMVAMAILGILATVGISSFRSSQIKTRDARRKSDLGQLQRALETYYNDHSSYPLSNDTGLIEIDEISLSWGGELKDDNDTVYMKELPQDPNVNPAYCYISDGSSYRLYAMLENSEDPSRGGPYSCGGSDNIYNFGLSSPNTTP